MGWPRSIASRVLRHRCVGSISLPTRWFARKPLADSRAGARLTRTAGTGQPGRQRSGNLSDSPASWGRCRHRSLDAAAASHAIRNNKRKETEEKGRKDDYRKKSVSRMVACQNSRAAFTQRSLGRWRFGNARDGSASTAMQPGNTESRVRRCVFASRGDRVIARTKVIHPVDGAIAAIRASTLRVRVYISLLRSGWTAGSDFF